MLDPDCTAAQSRDMLGTVSYDSSLDATAHSQAERGMFSLSGEAETTHLPVIFSSPHSGRNYPPELRDRTSIDLKRLRRSEDAFVDELISDAPSIGALKLCALFPRVFIDVNRRPDELDPLMFSDRLPEGSFVETRRTTSGLGVLPRITADGHPLYRRKFKFDEARDCLNAYYRPYHDALRDSMDILRRRFGAAVLFDVHSMPNHSSRGADIVLGDRFGSSCAARMTGFAENVFRDAGLVTVRNTPYAGGFTTEHYGRPDQGMHVLQIEINRGLYMDESRIAPTSEFSLMREKMSNFFNAVAKADWTVILAS